MGKPRVEIYLETLQGEGVPENIAIQCARILDKDDANKPSLGRTEQEQGLMNKCNEFVNGDKYAFV